MQSYLVVPDPSPVLLDPAPVLLRMLGAPGPPIPPGRDMAVPGAAHTGTRSTGASEEFQGLALG